MKKVLTYQVRVIIENEKALRALRVAAEAIDSLAEDLPWRDEPGKATRALCYAMKHLTLGPPREVRK